MRNEHQKIHQDLVAGSVNLIILEKDVDSEELKGLVNNVPIINQGEGEIGRPIEFGLDRDDGKSTGSFGLERLVVGWVVGLELMWDLPSGFEDFLL